jgi:hypothetical protein
MSTFLNRGRQYATGDEYLDQNAIPLIKELQKECEGDAHNSMESALEKTLQGKRAAIVPQSDPDQLLLKST